jgi:hypothetical protein
MARPIWPRGGAPCKQRRCTGSLGHACHRRRVSSGADAPGPQNSKNAPARINSTQGSHPSAAAGRSRTGKRSWAVRVSGPAEVEWA